MPFSQTDGFLASGAAAPADGLLRVFGPSIVLDSGTATSLAIHTASEALTSEGTTGTVTTGEAVSVAYFDGLERLAEATTLTTVAVPVGLASSITEAGGFSSVAALVGAEAIQAAAAVVVTNALKSASETLTDAGTNVSGLMPAGIEAFADSGLETSLSLHDGTITGFGELGDLLSSAVLSTNEVISLADTVITIAQLTGIPTVVDLVPVPTDPPILDSGTLVTISLLDGFITALGERGDLETLATLLAHEAKAEAGILTSQSNLARVEVLTEASTLASSALLEFSVLHIGTGIIADSGLLVSNALVLGQSYIPTVVFTIRRGPGRVPERRGFHDPLWYPDHYRVHR